jgi:hypothetical protein
MESLQIAPVNAQSSSLPAPPPYTLSTPRFRFRALASLAGRASLGGPREIALASYLMARLVDDCLPDKELPAAGRTDRSAAARTWLASVALPAAVRTSLTRLADATGGDSSEIGGALTNMIAAVDAYLDAPSRSELARLERATHFRS